MKLKRLQKLGEEKNNNYESLVLLVLATCKNRR